jgi:hypothetical protein
VTIAIRPSHEHETVANLPVICTFDQQRDLRHIGPTRLSKNSAFLRVDVRFG